MKNQNVLDLEDFVRTLKIGQKANVATSQYAMNTVADGFTFDHWSTPQAVRSLQKRGIITATYGWRYYWIIRLK
jgi:hypothetical protein